MGTTVGTRLARFPSISTRDKVLLGHVFLEAFSRAVRPPKGAHSGEVEAVSQIGLKTFLE